VPIKPLLYHLGLAAFVGNNSANLTQTTINASLWLSLTQKAASEALKKLRIKIPGGKWQRNSGRHSIAIIFHDFGLVLRHSESVCWRFFFCYVGIHVTFSATINTLMPYSTFYHQIIAHLRADFPILGG
jgi:hypothetical protein